MAVHTCFCDLLYLTLGEARFPWHPFSIESVIAPLTVLGSFRMPEDLVPRFLGPCEERTVVRSFRELSERGNPENPDESQALCTARAYIAPDFMLGGLMGSRNTSYQLHPLVAFWKTEKGLGTLKLLRCLPDGEMCHLHLVTVDALTDAHTARIHSASTVGRDILLFFEIECPGLTAASFTESVWHLPGLDVSVQSSLPLSVKAEEEGRVYRVYARLQAEAAVDIALTFTRLR